MARIAQTLLAAALLLALASPAPADRPAPGAPGDRHTWTAVDKHGFGTAAQLGSHAWFTLRSAELTEVYYPNLGTPSLRQLEFAVTDGRSFVDRETDANRALAPDEDLDRRSRPSRGPGQGALQVADPAQAPPLSARRPRPGRRRQRRPRRGAARRPGGVGRHGRERRRRGPRPARADERLRRHRQRSLGRPPARLRPRPLLRGRATRQRRAGRPHPPNRGAAPRSHDARHRLRGRDRVRRRHGARGAGGRIRTRGARLRRRLGRLPGLRQGATVQRRPQYLPPPRLRPVRDGPRGLRGQDTPRRVDRLPDHAVGVGHAHAGRHRELGPLPPGLAARPLPRRYGTAGARRRGRRHPPARVPVARPEA
jgi:Glucodextranase, domain N